MAEEFEVVQLHDDFYRDSFRKVIFIIVSILTAIGFLVAVSIYLFTHQPPPVIFPVDGEWRVKPEVALDQPHLSTPDLLQWVSDTMQKIFVFDFIHYDDQLQKLNQYFTQDGWQVFLNQLNNYVSKNNVQAYKWFVTALPSGAPIILQQGLLSGRYAWWVQIPVDINYASYNKSTKQTLTLQLLVVRISTLNNLSGVEIDNVIVASNTGTGVAGTSTGG